MILFTISTNVKLEATDLRDFISEAFPYIVNKIEEKQEVVSSVVTSDVITCNYIIDHSVVSSLEKSISLLARILMFLV